MIASKRSVKDTDNHWVDSDQYAVKHIRPLHARKYLIEFYSKF